MIEVQRGNIQEVIYARLEQGGDLLEQLHELCKQERVTTGLVMDITGSMRNLYVEHIPGVNYQLPPTADLKNLADVEPYFLNLDGPLEVSGHGIIGEGWAPDTEPPDPRGFFWATFKEHGDPYFHVHITGSNAETTICGHLLPGSIIQGSAEHISHFTVVIAKVAGVHLRGVWNQREGHKTTFHHEFVTN